MIVNHEIFKENNYWGNIGAGILPFCKTTKRFLIGLRSEYVKEPLTWGTFGGAINFEDDDDIVYDDSLADGATREFREETGYDGDVKLIQGYVFKDTNFTYTNFIGIVDTEFDTILNWENNETKWLNYEEMVNHKDLHFGLKTFIQKSKDLIESLL